MKRKILACVVACATLFLGMGYAYWTDSLQIDTKATTGELNVKFVDAAIYGQYGAEERATWAIFNDVPSNPGEIPNFFDRGTQYNIPWVSEKYDDYRAVVDEYTKTTFGLTLQNPVDLVPTGADDVYGHSTYAFDGFDLKVNNIYPGYAQIFRTDILNIGTIAAKLADVKMTLTNATGAHVDDMIGVSLKVLTEGHATVSVLEPTAPSQYFEVGGQKFIRLSALNALDITPEANTLFILPGVNTMDAYVGVAMDPDYKGDFTTGHVGLTPASSAVDANTQLENADFTIQFLWDQFNTKAPATTPAP